MRLAILADIHGNVLALEAVRRDLARRYVDRVVNLGDCVSGPLWPRETADLLMETGWPTVRGNHDRWVLDTSSKDHGSSDAFAYRELDAKQRAWLGDLPASLNLGDGILAIHGRPDNDNAYLLEDIEAGRLVPAPQHRVAARLAGITHHVVLCAHSHIPGAAWLAKNRPVINPGSVGCPAYEDPTPPAHVSESGTPYARYAVLELADGRVGFEHIAVSYDHLAAAWRAEANGRADWAHGLATGYARPRDS
jgi:predicted phosphodiesterase